MLSPATPTGTARLPDDLAVVEAPPQPEAWAWEDYVALFVAFVFLATVIERAGRRLFGRRPGDD